MSVATGKRRVKSLNSLLTGVTAGRPDKPHIVEVVARKLVKTYGPAIFWQSELGRLTSGPAIATMQPTILEGCKKG